MIECTALIYGESITWRWKDLVKSSLTSLIGEVIINLKLSDRERRRCQRRA